MSHASNFVFLFEIVLWPKILISNNILCWNSKPGGERERESPRCVYPVVWGFVAIVLDWVDQAKGHFNWAVHLKKRVTLCSSVAVAENQRRISDADIAMMKLISVALPTAPIDNQFRRIICERCDSVSHCSMQILRDATQNIFRKKNAFIHWIKMYHIVKNGGTSPKIIFAKTKSL